MTQQSNTPTLHSLPPFRTALLIIGMTVAAVLIFRFTLRGGPAPSAEDLPAPRTIQVETQDEVVIDPGTIPGNAIRNITIIPSHSHAFLRSIAYALIDEFKSIPEVDSVQILPELPSDKPIPPGLQLTIELSDLNESRTIEPRSMVTALHIALHIPEHPDPLPSLEVHQHAKIYGAETPTIWYREAAAAMVPGIVSNIVQATAQ